MNFIDANFDYRQYLRQRDLQIALALIIAGILGVGGFYIYKFRTDRIQKQAQKIFSEAMQSYKQALSLEFAKDVSEKEKQNMWSEVEIAFKTGHLQNTSSTLVPFFLAYEAQALIKQNKFDEAYEVLNESVEKIKKDTSFFYLYKITQALMDIDKTDVQKGIDSLNQLLNDKNNPFTDMAHYYLGEYYWSVNDLEKSKEQFQALDSMSTETDKKSESPWRILAKTRLQQLK